MPRGIQILYPVSIFVGKCEYSFHPPPPVVSQTCRTACTAGQASERQRLKAASEVTELQTEHPTAEAFTHYVAYFAFNPSTPNFFCTPPCTSTSSIAIEACVTSQMSLQPFYLSSATASTTWTDARMGLCQKKQATSSEMSNVYVVRYKSTSIGNVTRSTLCAFGLQSHLLRRRRGEH